MDCREREERDEMVQQADGSMQDSRIARAAVILSHSEDQKHSQNEEQKNLLI